MRARSSRRLAWSLCLLSVALLAVSAALSVAGGSGTIATEWGTRYNWVAFLASSLAFPVVGALVASRRRENAVGWLCLAIGVGIALSGLASEYGVYSLVTEPGSLPWGPQVAWFGNWSWLLYVVPIGVFLVLLFPNGHPPSRRWRAVLWAGILAVVIGGLSEALSPGRLDTGDIRNPYGLEDAEALLAVLDAASALLPVSFLAAGASMVVRFRGSRGVERQQLKWFAYAAVVLAALFGAEMAVVIATGLAANVARMSENSPRPNSVSRR